MNVTHAPRLATWILRRFGPKYCRGSMLGDLLEEYARRQSALWYWQEALTAVAIGMSGALSRNGLPLLRGLLGSWAVLITCLWSADSIAVHWLYQPSAPEGVVQAALRWTAWLALLHLAHGASGCVLAQVPRRYRMLAIAALLLSLLDWKLPVVGRLMYRTLATTHDAAQFAGSLVEFTAAILGIWLGMRLQTRRAHI